MNRDKIKEIEEVFGEEYTGTKMPLQKEIDILGCGKYERLPQLFINEVEISIFFSNSIWKAIVGYGNAKLVDATSLHSLKVKLELL